MKTLDRKRAMAEHKQPSNMNIPLRRNSLAQMSDTNVLLNQSEILECAGSGHHREDAEDILPYCYREPPSTVCGNGISLEFNVNNRNYIGSVPDKRFKNVNHQTDPVKHKHSQSNLNLNLPKDRSVASRHAINKCLTPTSDDFTLSRLRSQHTPDSLNCQHNALGNFQNSPTQCHCSVTGVFFKNLFGPDFEISTNYHFIIPPMVPDFLVKNATLADGVSPLVLGRGSFGRVIKAKLDSSLGHYGDIVVKEIFDSKGNTNAIFEEARILLYLERTGYVPLCFGVVIGVWGDVFGLLQECVGEGFTLDTYLWKERGKARTTCLLDIAKQLTDGLKEIHGMSVIVNDIKANNILMCNDNGHQKVKYCDMGLATYGMGRVFGCSTNADMFLYLAPEVRYGGTSSFKSDVYSLGYVLETIQDFGEFDCLFPAIDKCLVEEPEQRTTVEELALSVAEIRNHQIAGATGCKPEKTHCQRIISDNTTPLQKTSLASSSLTPIGSPHPPECETSGPRSGSYVQVKKDVNSKSDFQKENSQTQCIHEKTHNQKITSENETPLQETRLVSRSITPTGSPRAPECETSRRQPGPYVPAKKDVNANPHSQLQNAWITSTPEVGTSAAFKTMYEEHFEASDKDEKVDDGDDDDQQQHNELHFNHETSLRPCESAIRSVIDVGDVEVCCNSKSLCSCISTEAKSIQHQLPSTISPEVRQDETSQCNMYKRRTKSHLSPVVSQQRKNKTAFNDESTDISAASEESSKLCPCVIMKDWIKNGPSVMGAEIASDQLEKFDELCTLVVINNHRENRQSTFRILICTLLFVTMFKIVLILYF